MLLLLSYSGRATDPARERPERMTEARLFSSADIPGTNHASRATIMALHPCGCINEVKDRARAHFTFRCAPNRLGFQAAAVVNDASQELVHGFRTHIRVRCDNTDPNLHTTARLHTAVYFDQRYVRKSWN